MKYIKKVEVKRYNFMFEDYGYYPYEVIYSDWCGQEEIDWIKKAVEAANKYVSSCLDHYDLPSLNKLLQCSTFAKGLKDTILKEYGFSELYDAMMDNPLDTKLKKENTWIFEVKEG